MVPSATVLPGRFPEPGPAWPTDRLPRSSRWWPRSRSSRSPTPGETVSRPHPLAKMACPLPCSRQATSGPLSPPTYLAPQAAMPRRRPSRLKRLAHRTRPTRPTQPTQPTGWPNCGSPLGNSEHRETLPGQPNFSRRRSPAAMRNLGCMSRSRSHWRLPERRGPRWKGPCSPRQTSPQARPNSCSWPTTSPVSVPTPRPFASASVLPAASPPIGKPSLWR